MLIMHKYKLYLLFLILFICLLFTNNKLIEPLSITNHAIIHSSQSETIYTFTKLKQYCINKLVNGIIVTGKYLYIISNNTITIYLRVNGIEIYNKKTDFNHLFSGIMYNNLLFIVNKIPNNNSIIIFNLKLDYINNINIDLHGELLWIDYYNNIWWGCLKKNNIITLIEFDNEWYIKKQLYFAKEIINRLKPYIFNGQFHRQSGLLFLIGLNKKELLITTISNNKIKLITIVAIGVTNSISMDNNHLYGIYNNKIVLFRLEFNNIIPH